MKYCNLTQNQGSRNCYFRSTDIEQKNWKRLLWSVPDEMLYFMSLGKRIDIVDKATKDRNKVERIFVPVLNDLLNWLYFKREPKNRQLIAHFSLAYDEMMWDKMLYTKFKFWKKHIKKVDIRAKTIRVKKETCLI